MQANRLPAWRGLSWIRTSIILFGRNPPLLALCTILIILIWLGGSILAMFCLQLLAQTGLELSESGRRAVDLLMTGVLWQPLQLGMFRIFASLDRMYPPAFMLLLKDFRPQGVFLMLWGVVYMLILLALFGLTEAVFGVDLMKLLVTPHDKIAGVEAAIVKQSAATMVALTLPLLMADWFAPLLIGLCGMSIPKAAFFSFVACWRNFRTLLLFALSWCVLTSFGVVILGIVGSFSALLMLILSATVWLVVLPLWIGARYASARDIFGEQIKYDAAA